MIFTKPQPLLRNIVRFVQWTVCISYCTSIKQNVRFNGHSSWLLDLGTKEKCFPCLLAKFWQLEGLL